MHLNNPDLQAKVSQWVTETGRSAEELVEDAMAGYFGELAQVRTMLDSRNDDIKSGEINLIPGDEVIAGPRERSAARRSKSS